jgi:hypothetical protein
MIRELHRMTLTRGLFTSAFILALASPTLALEAAKQIEVQATPAATWTAIGDFCGIANWHPAVAKCELSEQDGAKLRTLSLNGGGTIIEKLTAVDDGKMSYSYEILESPLPVANYASTLHVEEAPGGALIVWTGTFDAKDAPDAKAIEVIEGIYDGGLGSLASKVKG